MQCLYSRGSQQMLCVAHTLLPTKLILHHALLCNALEQNKIKTCPLATWTSSDHSL